MIAYEDILEARDNLHPDIIRTPLQDWRHAGAITARQVRLKLETLQRTGSFKARGAWNRLRLLRPPQRRQGVICVSAGNHAQGVALAASLLGIKPVIVMPLTTPEIKIVQTRLYGQPEIIMHGSCLREAAVRARELEVERDLVFIHPYDDDAVIAGQGTIGLEILEQWPEVDTIVVPVGGGGLIAGIAMAVLSHHPDVRVVGVQVACADAAVRSLEAGKRVAIENCKTLADGIAVGEVGERPWAIIRRFGVPVLRVEEDWVRSTISALCQTAKLVVEAAGAVSATAVLFCSDDVCRGRRIAAVLSGANITMESFTETLRSHPNVPGPGHP